MHATDYLRKTAPAGGKSLVVLHGGERHLKLAALATLCRDLLGAPPDEALGLTRFDGRSVEFKTVRDEVLMVSMFSDLKIVLVEEADEFVTEHRPLLENYVDQPAKKSLLALELKTWRSNTRLAKKVEQSGLAIDCSELTGGSLQSWLVRQAADQYGKQLSRDAAQLLVELAGSGMGQLDQEIAKLTSYAGDRERITPEDVRALVGGWKAETTWAMIDAIRDGRPGEALQCLNKLLYAGEAGPKILGGMNYVFRKFATAIEDSRGGTPLRQALQQAGVFPRDVDKAEQYLRRIQRPRAERILEILAQTDYALKGGSRLPPALLLEQLVLQLSGAVKVEV